MPPFKPILAVLSNLIFEDLLNCLPNLHKGAARLVRDQRISLRCPAQVATGRWLRSTRQRNFNPDEYARMRKISYAPATNGPTIPTPNVGF
jgi:hypothetical protein